MQRLSSWVCGQWQEGTGEQIPLYNPTTEAVVAETSARGVDLGSALDYARTTGGAVLRGMTFAERAGLLKAMGKAIHAAREELIEVGTINAGNTRGDAKFDVDGATATLMYYAKLGEALGGRRAMLDGDPIQIGGARHQGQHILTPRPGVAIHINAFNFPAWGLAEKAACAILAGMPVVSKPATSTAWMTWAMVRAVDAAGVLPPGVLSLVCGRAHDLMDHAEWADVVAFTGGADTAVRIRSHPGILKTGAAVNIEADSLNSTVLVPGAKEATYNNFLNDVSREITQKAGQKCTATRRILIPEGQVDEFITHLAESLDRIVVGNPAQRGVRMGPLATAGQVESAHQGIGALREESEIVYGQLERGALAGVEDGKGYFVTPLVLRANDPMNGRHIHNLEVFGPVATILPYDGTAETACALIRLGQGSLVSSVYGDDRPFLKEAILGLAPHHGRLLITDAKVADEAYAPGLALPQLLHGGPGRAGGGEELGGARGMSLYQQRTAIQGNGPLIARLLEG
jgi:oxepin-CoA hydrolase/3-oxo-5,6-dehydrosuberyl-CoA semialdehyde dehydrogenase